MSVSPSPTTPAALQDELKRIEENTCTLVTGKYQPRNGCSDTETSDLGTQQGQAVPLHSHRPH